MTTTATTANLIDVTAANSLTTGSIMSLVSNSATTDTRSVAKITNDNTAATGATVLTLQQDSTAPVLTLDQNGNGIALNISGSANTDTNIISCSDADALTSGGFISLASNSSDGTPRTLAQITNTNTSATGATVMELEQNAATTALFIDHNADGTSLSISSLATTANVVDLSVAATTTGNVINCASANGLTSGRIAYFYSNSADNTARNLVEIVSDNGSANNATCLKIQQDGDEEGIFIDNNGTDPSITLDHQINDSSDIWSMEVLAANSGSGIAGGITFENMTATDFIFKVPDNATDPTGGGGAATGRIPIKIGATTRYIAYY